MTSVADLFTLQELDLALADRRSALTDVDSLLGDSEQLELVKVKVTELKDLVRKVEKQAKESEYEADEQRRKIEPIEARLYDGKVTNPKELEDLQLDFESLKRRRSDLDDKALEAIDALEAAQKDLAEGEQELERAEAAYRGDQQELGARRDSIEAEIAGLEENRTAQAELVDQDMIALYDRLAPTTQGRVVAKVGGGACLGCRISLPANVLQRARIGTGVVQCSMCQRILYVS